MFDVTPFKIGGVEKHWAHDSMSTAKLEVLLNILLQYINLAFQWRV